MAHDAVPYVKGGSKKMKAPKMTKGRKAKAMMTKAIHRKMKMKSY